MDRETFIRTAGDLLQQGPLPLATKKLWEIGRSSGNMTTEELSLLELRHTPPLWLLQSLGLDSSIAVSSQAEEIEARPSERIHCQSPEVIGDAILPPLFSMLDGYSPVVKIVKGNSGTFGLGNFMRVALVGDGYVPSMTDVNNLWTWQILKKLSPHRLPGRTFICVVEGSLLFSHWLFDTLPRFSILQQFGMEARHFDHVLVASDRHGFHREGLAAFRVDKSRVRTRQKIGPVVFCDEFVHVTSLRNAFLAGRGNWLYDTVTNIFAPGAGPGLRKLFISRSKAKRRRLINEVELHAVLTHFGFEIVHAEELSVAAMAKLCAEASIVVAPHGAGLANVAFMHPGGRVLELFGAHLSPEFWRICNSRDLRYYCMQGLDSAGKKYSEDKLKSMSHLERNREDFRIEPDALRNALAMVVES